MQLKVPPKEALENIERILKEGDDLLVKMSNKFIELYKDANVMYPIASNANSHNVRISITNNGVEVDKGKAETPDDYFEAQTPLLVELNNLFDTELLKWIKNVKIVFEKTFVSFVYIKDFISDSATLNFSYNGEVGKAVQEFCNMQKTVETKLKNLQVLFFKIEESIKSPLFYIKERSTLCYYDFVCELQADTNEASLCEYIFKFSIGTKKEIADIYKHMMGEEFIKGDEKVVQNALEGVNKKTQNHFGFSIFCKEKSVVYLQLKHSRM